MNEASSSESGASRQGSPKKEPPNSIEEVLQRADVSALNRLAPLESAANKLAWAVFFLVVFVVAAALFDYGCSASTSRQLVMTLATQPATDGETHPAVELHQQLSSTRRSALFEFIAEVLLPVFTLLLGYLFGSGKRARTRE